MSGMKRIISGQIAEGKAKGKTLASALSSALNSVTTANAKQELKKPVGK